MFIQQSTHNQVTGDQLSGTDRTSRREPLHFSSDPAVPSQLFGYDVLDLVGAGAGSRVYAVSDRASGQLYVLKHVVVRGRKDERYVEQLENEYEVGRHFAHPGLRRSIDFKVSRSFISGPKEAALILELCDGSPIEFVLPGRCAAILPIFIAAADALSALHKLGFVHCDLKPGNILVGGHDGAVKIIDFGQACRIGTAKARIQGTADFIAPEQVRCAACTPRTDVYCFGATLYWALCRKKMPTAYTIKREKNSFLLDDRIQSPTDANPSVPQRVSDLVMECVRTDASRRPPSMAEIKHRLEVLHFAMTRAPSDPRAIDMEDSRIEAAIA